ncbi:MAG: DUF1499 domain-containing protein [Pseudomonadota bacterium]
MNKKTWAERIRGFGYWAIVASAIAFVIAGPGFRFGILPLKAALLVSMGAVALGAIAFLASVVGLLMPAKQALDPKTTRTIVVAIASGALLFHIFGVVQTAQSVPRIHDISTDTVNPPAFVALAAARADAMNPLEYPGADVAAEQLAAYPDIQPLSFSATTPTAVIAAAAGVANNMGFSNIETLPSEGRLEATDTTFWYGYKDDIVVRAIGSGGDVVVDIRSKSRVGESDLGKNAARIRAFGTALEEAMR